MTDSMFVETRPEIAVSSAIGIGMPAHVWLELAGWIEGYIYALPETQTKTPSIGNLLAVIVNMIPGDSSISIGDTVTIYLPALLWLRIAGWYSWVPEGCEGMAALVMFVFQEMMTPAAAEERELRARANQVQRDEFFRGMFRQPGTDDAI